MAVRTGRNLRAVVSLLAVACWPLTAHCQSPAGDSVLPDAGCACPATIVSAESTSPFAVARDELPTPTATEQPGSLAPGIVKPTEAFPGAWGLVCARAYPLGDKVAPNGVEFTPVLSLDLHGNLWLWSAERLYFSSDIAFWGQRSAPGITNAHQGVFDFSKRELDLDVGLAWNYWNRFELRLSAYSSNNLNRGDSAVTPAGFSDMTGVENRYYLSGVYDLLGASEFDLSRATFVGLGYYASHDLTDSSGRTYSPGPYLHVYLTQEVYGEQSYLFEDLLVIATTRVEPKVLQFDVGGAFRPFSDSKRWEFRAGWAGTYDLLTHDLEKMLYAAVRFTY
jgi:hypothetical protein